jgi:hypothetical protein
MASWAESTPNLHTRAADSASGKIFSVTLRSSLVSEVSQAAPKQLEWRLP